MYIKRAGPFKRSPHLSSPMSCWWPILRHAVQYPCRTLAVLVADTNGESIVHKCRVHFTRCFLSVPNTARHARLQIFSLVASQTLACDAGGAMQISRMCQSQYTCKWSLLFDHILGNMAGPEARLTDSNTNMLAFCWFYCPVQPCMASEAGNCNSRVHWWHACSRCNAVHTSEWISRWHACFPLAGRLLFQY